MNSQFPVMRYVTLSHCTETDTSYLTSSLGRASDLPRVSTQQLLSQLQEIRYHQCLNCEIRITYHTPIYPDFAIELSSCPEFKVLVNISIIENQLNQN